MSPLRDKTAAEILLQRTLASLKDANAEEDKRLRKAQRDLDQQTAQLAANKQVAAEYQTALDALAVLAP